MIVMTALPGIIAGLVVLSSFAGQFGYIATTLLGGPLLLWNIIVSAGIFLVKQYHEAEFQYGIPFILQPLIVFQPLVIIFRTLGAVFSIVGQAEIFNLLSK